MKFLAISPDGKDMWVEHNADIVVKQINGGSLAKFYYINQDNPSGQVRLQAVTIKPERSLRKTYKVRDLEADDEILATIQL